MPSAEIIAIGTELLLGVIADTNTAFIARELNKIGIDVFRTVIIGDNQSRIAEEIRNSLTRADIVITTGGLGPTVDDLTRDAVAEACAQKIEFVPQLWEDIIQRYRTYGKNPSENNRRQAFIPQGATAIRNPVGTAPAFFLKNKGKIIFSLPGVPSEMKALLQDAVIPRIQKEFQINATIFSRTIRTAGIGESSIDELISDLEHNDNPTVGLSAYPAQVDIRITAKAKDRDQACRLIQPIEKKIRDLLGDYVYGTDEDTLIHVVTDLASSMDVKIFILCSSDVMGTCFKKTSLYQVADLISTEKPADALYNDSNQQLTVTLTRTNLNPFKLRMHTTFNKHESFKELQFGGHPFLFPQWVENQVLFYIWQHLLQAKGMQ